MSKRKNLEHKDQVALISWAEWQLSKYPELEMLYALPNAGKRSPVMGKMMKAEGMRKGILDLNLDVPKRGYHGWRGELKIGKNKPTDEQYEWIEKYRKWGYFADWFTGWEAMKESILWYLK